MSKRLTRRDFLRCSALGTAAVWAGADRLIAEPQAPLVAVVKNGSPADLVTKALEALGGIERFVSAGQTVLIKPNIGWDRSPEQAANTNPEAVAQLVRLCLKAGAKRVRVLDRTCNQPLRCYRNSGIEEAAKAAGAQVLHVNDAMLKSYPVTNGVALKECRLYRDAMENDVFINFPIAKHHSMATVTLGMKNLMGILGGNRGAFHSRFEDKIVDLTSLVRPTLTLIDGYRVLLRNGPTGGNLADTAERRTLIASTDIVAADALATELLGVKAADIPYIRNAFERGLGEIRREKMIIKEINLG